MRATVARTETLVLDLPERAYRDGERVRICVDSGLMGYVDPELPVAVSIGGVMDPLYPVYKNDGERMRAGNVTDRKEYDLKVIAGRGGRFVVA